jgi:hypothetical protein
LADDVAVTGDYDGDGRTDPAIYRNGQWWMLQSALGVGVVDWGLSTDKPVPAAYLP